MNWANAEIFASRFKTGQYQNGQFCQINLCLELKLKFVPAKSPEEVVRYFLVTLDPHI